MPGAAFAQAGASSVVTCRSKAARSASGLRSGVRNTMTSPSFNV